MNGLPQLTGLQSAGELHQSVQRAQYLTLDNALQAEGIKHQQQNQQNKDKKDQNKDDQQNKDQQQQGGEPERPSQIKLSALPVKNCRSGSG